MTLVQRKSEPDRLLETLSNSVGVVSSGVSGGLNRSTLVKAGLVAGGLAALTAGSAAVSSIRRRMEANDS
jgi:hypothetical protein